MSMLRVDETRFDGTESSAWELTWVEQRELELASAHFSDVKRPEPTVKIL